MVIHQVAMPRIECKEQEQADICLKPGCRLVSNNTDCLTTDIPTEVSSSSRDKLVLPSCSSFLWLCCLSLRWRALITAWT